MFAEHFCILCIVLSSYFCYCGTDFSLLSQSSLDILLWTPASARYFCPWYCPSLDNLHFLTILLSGKIPADQYFLNAQTVSFITNNNNLLNPHSALFCSPWLHWVSKLQLADYTFMLITSKVLKAASQYLFLRMSLSFLILLFLLNSYFLQFLLICCFIHKGKMSLVCVDKLCVGTV